MTMTIKVIEGTLYVFLPDAVFLRTLSSGAGFSHQLFYLRIQSINQSILSGCVQIFTTGEYYFPCSADHEQDWQPYPVDPYSAICDDHTYIHTYIHTY